MPTATIPQGLGAMTPGPSLGALLDGIDLTAVGAPETVSTLVAAYRRSNHAQSVVMAVLVEVGPRSPTPEDPMERMESFDRWLSPRSRPNSTSHRSEADPGRTAVTAPWGPKDIAPALHELLQHRDNTRAWTRAGDRALEALRERMRQ